MIAGCQTRNAPIAKVQCYHPWAVSHVVRSFARLLLITLIGVTLGDVAHAQTATLSGVALDTNGNPVAGATVTVCPANTSGIPCGNPLQVVQSVGNGSWIVYIASGTYTVTVNRGGLVSTTQQLSTGNALGCTVSATFACKPATSDAIQYVSTNGNDSNDGLSMGTAKRTIAAAVTTLNAPVTGGGKVYVAAGIYAGGISLQSGVLIIGAGRGATEITAPVGSAAFDIPAGTFHAHIEALWISVTAATSTGITIEGNIPAGKFTEENTIRNVTIQGDGKIGEHGLNAQGTASIGDVSLNRFDAVETRQIDIPFICHFCEGNVWTDTQVVNYSYNNTAGIAFDATGAYDQYVQLRVSDPVTGSGVIAYFNDGQRNQVQVYCESALSLSQSCVKDAGVQNMYLVTAGNLSTSGTSLTGKSGIFTNTSTVPFYFEFPTGLPGGSPILELADAGGTVHAFFDNNGVYNYEDGSGHLGILATNTLTSTPINWNLPNLSGTLGIDINSGTATMTTAAITAGNCGTTVTVVATGVLTTDAIQWAFNAAPAGSNAGLVAWPTAGNVNFAYCPNSAETPAAATINWKVMR